MKVALRAINKYLGKDVFLAAILTMVAASSAMGADLIVSGNDAKFVREGGVGGYPEGVGPDTLTVIDASVFPPKVVETVEVRHTLSGPPQQVGITPTGELAIVSAPTFYDHSNQSLVMENYLQIVDLTVSPAEITQRVDVGTHPQAVAINREGDLMLVSTVAGTVVVLEIDGKSVEVVDEIKISDGRLSGISFTHDGSTAIVGLRDEQGAVVLNIVDGVVSTELDRITTGIAPYAIDVSSDGKWAVIGNVGLAGIVTSGHQADADSFTLVDTSSKPYRAVQHVTVPSIPEAVTISPDGRWIAVQTMNGSSLPYDADGYNPVGTVLLYEIQDGQAVKTSELPNGEASQGMVFTADNKYLLVQFSTEQEIAVFAVNDGDMEDTGERIPVSGAPVSIRSMPR